ncbi:sulfite exporter TauE/SafE family protein [Sanyastnella coralliicola]|uniref:sulfite exporter TauE/SafE family protein n=1 Tax=Sanyastnella coralliicola TaxID=3069118 RepID=UPI0027B930D6|nr:sulfite exporter TauE/SafE family protein [Longitalea sp. SCSIO 12813]
MLWAGLILGLASSLHCLGMCGPLVLALPGGNKSASRRWFNRFNYHLGRIVVYGVLGSIAGLIANGIELFTWQRSVAIFGGIAMIVFALVPALVHKMKFTGPLAKWLGHTRSSLFKQLQREDVFSWVFLGAVNALLPCGAIFVALAGALTTGSFAGGALFMMLFGTGTAVSLLLLHLIKDRVGFAQKSLNRIAPWLMASLGILLLVRGMDLDIPYLSPGLDLMTGNVGGCH